MQKNGGIVKAAYITYDSKDVDNVNFFQWPLGVATWSFLHTAGVALEMNEKHLNWKFIDNIESLEQRVYLL